MTVPEDAAFAVRVVFVPTDRAVDGVGYLVGVSDGHTYRTIDTATVGGRAARAQQREVRVRLDEYAGMTINLVLNTRPLNLREAADVTALWCSPRIIAAR